MTIDSTWAGSNPAAQEILELFRRRIQREVRLFLRYLPERAESEPDQGRYVDGQIGLQLSHFLLQLVEIAKRHDVPLEEVLACAASIGRAQHTDWEESRFAGGPIGA